MVLKNNFKKSFCALCAIFIFASSIFALEVPALKGRVNDYANIMKKADIQELESYLASLEDASGIQLAVLTIPSLENEDIAVFGLKVAEKWGLGQSKEDNGALLLVAYDEHQLRIDVGYGLEDKLTDVKCGLIIRNVIIPEFQEGNYSKGIVKGIKNMAGIASDNMEIVAKSVQDNASADDEVGGVIFMLIWIIFIFLIISSRGGIFKWIFLSKLFGSNHSTKPFNSPSNHTHTNFGGFNSSNFGGGFGGFSGGGGHFGGGGASGRW